MDDELTDFSLVSIIESMNALPGHGRELKSFKFVAEAGSGT
jgi:hypothetical protein